MILRLLSILAGFIALVTLCAVTGLVALGVGWGLSGIAPVTPFQGAMVVLAAAALLALHCGLGKIAENPWSTTLRRLADAEDDDGHLADELCAPVAPRRVSSKRRDRSG